MVKRQRELLASLDVAIGRLDPHGAEISADTVLAKKSAQLLADWKATDDAICACLLVPILQQGLTADPVFRTLFSDRAKGFAKEVVAELSSAAEFSESARTPSQRLRTLIRRAYLDLPDLSVLMILVARHDIALQAPDVSMRIAAETEAVFVPLAETLGLWSLRRNWLETIAPILWPTPYAEMKRLIQESANETLENVGRPDDLHAFISGVRNVLRETHFGPLPRIQQARATVGVSVYRSRNGGDSRQELAERRGVRILCRTLTDCYRVLAGVHAVGRPVTAGYHHRETFRDYIVTPRANGYQALVTVVEFRFGSPRRRRVIEVQIMTASMYRLNEGGAAAASHAGEGIHGQVGAWWDRTQELSRRLQDGFGQTVDYRTFMSSWDISSRSNPLYCFTPAGEVRILPDGATALDFAYDLHSDLGHHAVGVEVNGEATAFSHPLRNGDIVRVYDDVHGAGPDLSWLGAVKTPKARAEIRRALSIRSRTQHLGRARIEKDLLQYLRYYEVERRCPLDLTDSRVDVFLATIAQRYQLSSLEGLYDAVEKSAVSSVQICKELIVEELARRLIDSAGDPIQVPNGGVSFCDLCRPVPGDPIVAFLRPTRRASNRLVIHRTNDAKCEGPQSDADPVHVRWAATWARQDELIRLEVKADDRKQLLTDLLNALNNEHLTVHQVGATTQDNGRADIQVIVSGSTLPRFGSSVQPILESIPSVRHVFALPAAASHMISPLAQPALTPYHESEVFDVATFYDREEQQASILQWLNHPRVPVLVLHGHGRVGKTSLAKYVQRDIKSTVHMPAPIFVDAQGIAPFTLEAFCRRLIEALEQLAAVSQPPIEPVDPISTLRRLLRATRAALGGRRLFIAIDEFSHLLDLQNAGRLDDFLFNNLRSLFNDDPDVLWLLIIHEAQFRTQSQWGRAGAILQTATDVYLPHLDSAWARKLIEEPAYRAGYSYERGLVDRVLDSTNANPFFINVLGNIVVSQARRSGRQRITANDLDLAEAEMLARGDRLFFHLIQWLSEDERVLLMDIASTLDLGESKSVLSLVGGMLRAPASLVTNVAAQIQSLESRGAVAVAGSYVSIPVRIFHSWLKDSTEQPTSSFQVNGWSQE